MLTKNTFVFKIDISHLELFDKLNFDYGIVYQFHVILFRVKLAKNDYSFGI